MTLYVKKPGAAHMQPTTVTRALVYRSVISSRMRSYVFPQSSHVANGILRASVFELKCVADKSILQGIAKSALARSGVAGEGSGQQQKSPAFTNESFKMACI